METVGQRIVERAAQRVVGRERELGVLCETLAEDGPLVAFVHGLGGIGKTTLVGAYAELARRRGVTVAAVDCGLVEPTERGLLAELATVAGGEATLSGVLDRIGSFDAAVVVLDAYERFRLLDTWIRRTLVPALPVSARVVIASREPPAPGWDASPATGAPVRSIELGPLSEEAAVAVLREGGAMDDPEARRLNRFVHGHPLALRVAGGGGAGRARRGGGPRGGGGGRGGGGHPGAGGGGAPAARAGGGPRGGAGVPGLNG
jgi:hypothetical protein